MGTEVAHRRAEELKDQIEEGFVGFLRVASSLVPFEAMSLAPEPREEPPCCS